MGNMHVVTLWTTDLILVLVDNTIRVNAKLVIYHSYSSKFPLGRSTSVKPILIWLPVELSDFFLASSPPSNFHERIYHPVN